MARERDREPVCLGARGRVRHAVQIRRIDVRNHDLLGGHPSADTVVGSRVAQQVNLAEIDDVDAVCDRIPEDAVLHADLVTVTVALVGLRADRDSISTISAPHVVRPWISVQATHRPPEVGVGCLQGPWTVGHGPHDGEFPLGEVSSWLDVDLDPAPQEWSRFILCRRRGQTVYDNGIDC